MNLGLIAWGELRKDGRAAASSCVYGLSTDMGVTTCVELHC